MNGVLWVEDSPDQMLLLDIILDELGAAVVYDTAGTVQEAVKQVLERHEAGTPYRLVACDLQLPGGTGWDVFEAFVDSGQPRDRFLMVSASSDPRDRVAAADAGCGYLVKPSALNGWRRLAELFIEHSTTDADPSDGS